MFRTLARTFLPNPLDWKLRRCAKKGGKKVLVGWNRGLGDIALGLYAIVKRIRDFLPEAEITFLTRENLRDGFSLLEGVHVLTAPFWKRGEETNVKETLRRLGRTPREYDLIIDKPSPTDWVSWQRGRLVPRLKWDPSHDEDWKRFNLPEGLTYIGVQVVAETSYGLWRNWPLERWSQLFDRLERLENVRVLLFGFGETPPFPHKNLIDLRGRTNLFELLSLIKNRCRSLILPDSGILSMAYYLDIPFPLQILSLWADPRHGLLKQNVASPNPQLVHHSLIGEHRDLSTVSAEQVMNHLFPPRPLQRCPVWTPSLQGSRKGVGCILLAGGQGARLGIKGPKGTFSIRGKSLFQWLCEKAPSRDFPLAIMTSPLNDAQTQQFFRQHHFFGREIFFFQQELLPLLDEQKRPLSLQGPNGNGAVFRAFCKAGLDALFAERGIDLLTVIPVENLLADPADTALIAHHRATGAQITVKCVERERPEEPMGALVEREGRIEIVEYLHLQPNTPYRYAHTGMLAVDFAFFCQMASYELPLHWVQKKNLWKREHFIFDALPYAQKVTALCYPRSFCYAPLKSLENLEAIEELLQRR